jgi:hypothetical protein
MIRQADNFAMFLLYMLYVVPIPHPDHVGIIVLPVEMPPRLAA